MPPQLFWWRSPPLLTPRLARCSQVYKAKTWGPAALDVPDAEFAAVRGVSSKPSSQFALSLPHLRPSRGAPVPCPRAAPGLASSAARDMLRAKRCACAAAWARGAETAAGAARRLVCRGQDRAVAGARGLLDRQHRRVRRPKVCPSGAAQTQKARLQSPPA